MSHSRQISCRSTYRRKALYGLSLACCALLASGISRAGTPQSSSSSGTSNKKSKSTLKSMPAPAPVVLVFPPDTKGGVTDALTDVITDVEQSRLSIVGNYHPIYFLRSLPTIQRSVSEQSLNSSDVRPPFDNNAKVTRLAKLLGYPMLIVGAIEDYQYDASKKTVTLLLSARMLDVSEAKPRIIRSVTLPGSGAATAKETSEESTAVRVARDTAEKLMTDLLKPTKPSTTAPAAGAAK